jgi:hypothetical protein
MNCGIHLTALLQNGYDIADKNKFLPSDYGLQTQKLARKTAY